MCRGAIDIDGFSREINEKHGTLFGRSLLQARRISCAPFPEEALLFRGADSPGELPWLADSVPVCAGYFVVVCMRQYVRQRTRKVPYSTGVAFGIAPYVPGESVTVVSAGCMILAK